MTDLSVVICTRNPRPQCLRRVLDALRAQTLSRRCWELVIVDNGGAEKASLPADLAWHPAARLVREEVVGLTHARLKGIAEASGDLLVFVDDDNVLAPDYLEQALGLVQSDPRLGVAGAGVLEGEFEISPSRELTPWLDLIGVTRVHKPVYGDHPMQISPLPVGAGICVRREVAQAYSELVTKLDVNDVIGRRDRRLFSGDDDLFSWTAPRVGKRFGLFPQLRLLHLICADRLTRAYFRLLVHDHALSHGVLRYVLTGAEPRRATLSRKLRVIAHGLKNGLFSAQCAWSELRGEEAAWRYCSRRRLQPLNRISYSTNG